MPEPRIINIVHPDSPGKTFAIPESDLPDAISQGFRPESPDQAVGRVQRDVNEQTYGGVGGAVAAGGLALARGATLGASDAALAALGGRRDVEGFREAHPIASLGGEVAGAALTGGAGLADAAGARAGRVAADAGTLAKIAGAARGAAAEGAVYGAGQGVTELALSDDPVTIERAASTIGMSALFGGATGGALGAAGKGIELGLSKAKSSLDKLAAKGVETGGEVGQDLAALDAKGLRAARKTELDAIETARVTERAKVADEIKAFRTELKENKPWLATKDSDDPAIRAIGARTRKADRALDNILDDPKALAESPKPALKQLRVQEAALDDLVTKHAPSLSAKFAADTSGERQAALDYATTALQKNRTLQARIESVSSAPTSARLDAIQEAMDGLGKATTKQGTTIGEMLGASALGHAVGAVAGVPYLGQAVLAAKAVGGVVKRLTANSAEAAARGSKAIQAFLDVGKKVAPSAPVVGTKVLGAVRFGLEQKSKANDLAAHYQARATELRNLTAPGPDGQPVMRSETRAMMADKLAPIRAVSPLAADRIETVKARSVEFLASKLPKRPDVGGIQTGPDKWQPADMEMRAFSRYVAAVEDPHGVIERMADGKITPEDVEAIKNVYPELHADITRQIVEQLGELRAQLPYQRRLALSMFSGVPVDPALDPRVLSQLQAQFTAEEGTQQGTQAPSPQPQFGSVKRAAFEATPSQKRAEGVSS